MSKAQSTHTDDADLEPVDLDPPAPEIARWQELVDRETVIYHGGDAEKVIPFRRPAWASPDGDIIGSWLDTTYYTSELAPIPLEYARGLADEEMLKPAVLLVRAKLCGDGRPIVGLGLERFDGKSKKWISELGQGLTLAEAEALADVLRAAVALHGGGK